MEIDHISLFTDYINLNEILSQLRLQLVTVMTKQSFCVQQLLFCCQINSHIQLHPHYPGIAPTSPSPLLTPS